MTPTVIISIGIWVLSIIVYIIVNLFNKNRKLEKMVINQQQFIDNVKGCMKEINTCANQIDSKLWVQSDPEFLSLMESVKEMQTRINDFIED
jgi:Sec-independent protein translocase protein TatA